VCDRVTQATRSHTDIAGPLETTNFESGRAAGNPTNTRHLRQSRIPEPRESEVAIHARMSDPLNARKKSVERFHDLQFLMTAVAARSLATK